MFYTDVSLAEFCADGGAGTKAQNKVSDPMEKRKKRKSNSVIYELMLDRGKPTLSTTFQNRKKR